MSQRADLPLRAEDAVAKLKRSREATSSPELHGSEKRMKPNEDSPKANEGPAGERDPAKKELQKDDSGRGETRREEPAAGREKPREEPGRDASEQEPLRVVDNSDVLDDVAGFERRIVGSVVYAPNKILVAGHELQLNAVLQVRVGHQFISKDAIPVVKRAAWGTEVYTDDTDLVAALHHLGYLGQDKNEYEGKDLLVDLLLLPPLRKYTGSLRNNYNSRTWLTRHDGISYMVLGKPKPMARGWAHAGKELLSERYAALKEVREWDSRNIAYV